MIELSVENLHLTYGDNPVLKGVSMELRRGRSSRCSAHRGAEKPRCCGRSPGWRSPPAARSLSVKPAFMTATRVVKFRRRSVTWVWCSSPTPCGRIKRYLRTWLTPSGYVRSLPRRSNSGCRACSISWAWGILAIAIRISSPEDSSSAWPSAGRWYITRRSFCWMNPCRTSTLSCGKRRGSFARADRQAGSVGADGDPRSE